MSTIVVQQKLTTIVCAECAMLFAVPERFETDRRNDHQRFHCPNGHINYFAEKTLLEQTKAKLLEATARADAEERARIFAEEAAANAQKKLRLQTKRVNAGVCPHCTRTFANMARHIACKHPEVAK